MYTLNWAYAYGKPLSSARFKATPEDFEVHELFDYAFSGEGEHILLKIEKRGLTTEEVAKALARSVNKPLKLISYAGLKDRQALCTQWFSIHAPGEQIEGVGQLHGSGWRVIDHTRHNKKLRPGSLAGNHFVVTLNEVHDGGDLLWRIERIKASGVPNYFGEQRFGREGANLNRAEELLVHNKKVKDRFLKGMYCSAARSWLYNLILSSRVTHQTWNKALCGDVMQLNGTHSIFVTEAPDGEIIKRIEEKDISPASPLAGKSKNKVMGEALELINQIYADWQPWLLGLERLGMEEAWRANILHAIDLDYSRHDNVMTLSFNLPAGSYATALLRELVIY